MHTQIIKREQMVVSACLCEEPGEHPGACVCTALAYWPYWESPEASKLAEAITKCINGGWTQNKTSVRLLLEPDFKPWVDHPTFQDGLPYSCVEDEARALLPHYKSKRIIELVGNAYAKMFNNPESARQLALDLKLELGDWV